MRWASLGWFESEVWAKHVLGFKSDPSNPDAHNKWLVRQGLDLGTAQALTNPGFTDPWNPRRDITIDLIQYRWFGLHLMTGKLDWLLTRQCKASDNGTPLCTLISSWLTSPVSPQHYMDP